MNPSERKPSSEDRNRETVTLGTILGELWDLIGAVGVTFAACLWTGLLAWSRSLTLRGYRLLVDYRNGRGRYCRHRHHDHILITDVYGEAMTK